MVRYIKRLLRPLFKKEFEQKDAEIERLLGKLAGAGVAKTVDMGISMKVGYVSGYESAVKDFSYWKGGEQYIGHDRPRKTAEVLAELEARGLDHDC